MNKTPINALDHPLALEGKALEKARAIHSYAMRYKVPAVTLFPADYRLIANQLTGSGFDIRGGGDNGWRRPVEVHDMTSLKHHSIVRKLNRKQALLRLEDIMRPWAIALCFVALVAFFQWLDWPTGYPVMH